MNSIRRYFACSLLMCFVVGVLPARADISSQCPPDTDGIDTDGDGIVDNDHVCIHVSAGDGVINMADDGRRIQYMFGFHDVTGLPDSEVMSDGLLGANMPSPTIVVREGQKLYLSLSNVGMVIRPDLFDPHTIHYHGFPEAASIFDGVPEPSVSVNMGATFTYFYNIVEQGTYAYHCHVEATEHMQMGMLGNLYVLPIQNRLPNGTPLGTNGFVHSSGFKYCYNDGDGSTYYDVEYPLQIETFDPDFHDASMTVQPLPFALMDDRYPMFNGRGYPDTVNTNALLNTADDLGYERRFSQDMHSLITATRGQKILLRLSSMSTIETHTLTTTLGVPMKVVGRDGRLLRGPDGKNLYYDTATIDVAGGEMYEAIIDTTDVEAGTYFLYTTNLDKLSNDTEDFGGLMTEIVISAPPPSPGPVKPPAGVTPIKIDRPLEPAPQPERPSSSESPERIRKR